MLLSALNLYNQKSSEKRRFQHLVLTLEQVNSPELILSVMKLINALIEMHEGIEARMSMRLEFISLDLEVTIYNQLDPSADLQQQITQYNYRKDEDSLKYKQLHAGLILPEWADGTDFNGLANTLVTRWASTPNLQSVVCATLCSLLEIPNDGTHGTASWIFLNKVVSQIAGKFKDNMAGMLDVDLKTLFNTAQATEITLKKELEELTQTTTQQAEQIQSLQIEVAKASEEKSAQEEQIRSLRNEVATLEKQKEIENDSREKLNVLEKSIQEADPIKPQKGIVLQEKLDHIEHTQPESQQPENSVPTTSAITANAKEPLSSLPEDSILVKEEMRMLRAISRPGFTGAQGRARTTSDMPKGVGIKLNDSFTSPRVPRVSATTAVPFSPNSPLPEWKYRLLEREKETMEKFEQEQLKKQEHLNAVVGSIVSSGSGVLAQEEIPPSQLQLSDLSVSEKEEQRLKRALNKAHSTRPFAQK